jgi:hypothetical protein
MIKFLTVFATLSISLVLTSQCYSQCSGALCTTTLTTNSTGAITVNSGTYCINANAGNITISHNVTVSGTGTICINASAGNINFTGTVTLDPGGTLNFYSATNDTVKISGSFNPFGNPANPRFFNNYGNLQMNVNDAGIGWRCYKGMAIVNNGRIEVKNNLEMASSASITNNGTIVVGGYAQINAGVNWTNNASSTISIGGALTWSGNSVTNGGTINVGGNLALSGTWTNNTGGAINVEGNSTANSSTNFSNYGTWHTTGNATINFNMTNGGLVDVDGLLTINASGILNFNNGKVTTKDLVLQSGNMTTGAGCAAIVATGSTNVISNGFQVTSGSVDITDESQTHGATPALDANTCPVAIPANCGLTFSNTQGTNSCLNSSLPVSLVSFTGKYLNATQVELEWTTLTEENNLQFIVERSEDLTTFQPVATIQGSNQSDDRKTYTINDNFSNSGNDVYYRLRQRDINGSMNDLAIILPDRPEGEFTVDIYPNPNKGQFKVACQGKHSIRHIQILDNVGQTVYEHDDFSTDPNQTFTFALENLKGIYILSVATDEEIKYRKIHIE